MVERFNILLLESTISQPSRLKLGTPTTANVVERFGALGSDSLYRRLLSLKQLALLEALELNGLQLDKNRPDVTSERAPAPCAVSPDCENVGGNRASQSAA